METNEPLLSNKLFQKKCKGFLKKEKEVFQL